MDPRTPPPRRRRELKATPAPLDQPRAACDGKRARKDSDDLAAGVLCALPLVLQHLALADRAKTAVSRAWRASGEEWLAWDQLVIGRHPETDRAGESPGFYLTAVHACHVELDQLKLLPARLRVLCELARHVTLVAVDGAVPQAFQRLRFPRLERATVGVP